MSEGGREGERERERTPRRPLSEIPQLYTWPFSVTACVHASMQYMHPNIHTCMPTSMERVIGLALDILVPKARYVSSCSVVRDRQRRGPRFLGVETFLGF